MANDIKVDLIEITLASANGYLNKLYNYEALTHESSHKEYTKKELVRIANWFKENSKCNIPGIEFYITSGEVMNKFYNLTGDNRYDKDDTILFLNWFITDAKDIHKGNWRYFSDVVDNNAKREIAKRNFYYKHYTSMYYGPIGWDD